MKADASLTVGATPDRVVPYVADLGRFREWMPLVHEVEVDTSTPGETAWLVELRAKVGVFARSKRLRMVRIENGPETFVFERRETDGRRHSPWVLTVGVEAVDAGTRVSVSLVYGGSLWTGGILDKVLASQIETGKSGLARVVEG
ncbi:MAG: SRPBCC family protein [Ilumatobacteraceae bacterium]